MSLSISTSRLISMAHTHAIRPGAKVYDLCSPQALAECISNLVISSPGLLAVTAFLACCCVIVWCFQLRSKTATLELYTPADIDRIAKHSGLSAGCPFTINVTNIAGQVDSQLTVPHKMPNGIQRRILSENMAHADFIEYRQACSYFRLFLAKGHAALGRKGPTCPYVPLALKKNSLYMGVVRSGSLGAPREFVRKVARQFVQRYHTLEPTDPKSEVYKAVLLIFPDISLDQAQETIDKVQEELKQEFVDQGLMIGEFHKKNNSHGLHSSTFFPLRTPTPCLAIRRIVPSDIAFLDLAKYSAVAKRSLLENYLKHFEGAKLPMSDKKLVMQAKQSLLASGKQ